MNTKTPNNCCHHSRSTYHASDACPYFHTYHGTLHLTFLIFLFKIYWFQNQSDHWMFPLTLWSSLWPAGSSWLLIFRGVPYKYSHFAIRPLKFSMELVFGNIDVILLDENCDSSVSFMWCERGGTPCILLATTASFSFKVQGRQYCKSIVQYR
jgi:hypothetical protein